MFIANAPLHSWAMSEFAPLLLSSHAFIFAGFFVGFVAGLTGVGGGSLMTPLLIFGFGIKPHLAIGTDLLFAAFTKLGGTVSLVQHRFIDWRVVGQVALGSVPACLVTLYILQQLGPANPALPLPRILADDIAHAVPLTLVAGLGHASIGSVDWLLLAKLLAGSLPGIWLGTAIMKKTPDRIIRSLLSVLLAYAGLKLIAI